MLFIYRIAFLFFFLLLLGDVLDSLAILVPRCSENEPSGRLAGGSAPSSSSADNKFHSPSRCPVPFPLYLQPRQADRRKPRVTSAARRRKIRRHQKDRFSFSLYFSSIFFCYFSFTRRDCWIYRAHERIRRKSHYRYLCRGRVFFVRMK